MVLIVLQPEDTSFRPSSPSGKEQGRSQSTSQPEEKEDGASKGLQEDKDNEMEETDTEKKDQEKPVEEGVNFYFTIFRIYWFLNIPQQSK